MQKKLEEALSTLLGASVPETRKSLVSGISSLTIMLLQVGIDDGLSIYEVGGSMLLSAAVAWLVWRIPNDPPSIPPA